MSQLQDTSLLGIADSILDNDIDEEDGDPLNNKYDLHESISNLNIIDDKINELYDTEEISNESITSLGSDWSDQPRIEIGYDLHKIYQYLIYKKKESNSSDKLNVNNKKKPQKQNQINPASLNNIHVSMEQCIKLRLKIAKHYINTYHMKSLISLRDISEFCKLTIKQMKQSNIESDIPNTILLAQSMLCWQAEPIYTALTTNKSNSKIEKELKKCAPKMFQDIQYWMKEGSPNDMKLNETSVSKLFNLIQICQTSNISDTDEKELRKCLSNELFVQITKQISGNPINESVRRGLRILYLLILYCRPSKDVFKATKFRLAKMVTENCKMHKLYSFATVEDSVCCIFDAILFVERFRCITGMIQFEDVYIIRTKDSINRQKDFNEALMNPISLKDMKILHPPTKQDKKHGKHLSFQPRKLLHSMVNFNAKYCGSETKAKTLQKVSIKMFEDLMKICHLIPISSKEIKKWDPTYKLQQLIALCQQEKLLRDEYFMQLIKQTTNNNGKLCELFGWKLIFIGLKYLLPTEETLKLLQCHSAKKADATYSEHTVNIPQISHHVFAMSFEYLWQLKNDKIKAPVKAKKSFIRRIIGDIKTDIVVTVSKWFANDNHNSLRIKRNLSSECDLKWLTSSVLSKLGIKMTSTNTGTSVDLVVTGADWIQQEVKCLVAKNKSLEIFRQELLKWKESTPQLSWKYVFYKREWTFIDWKLEEQSNSYVNLVYAQLCENLRCNKLTVDNIEEAIKLYTIQTLIANKGNMIKFYTIKDEYIRSLISEKYVNEMELEKWKYKIASYSKKLYGIIGITKQKQSQQKIESKHKDTSSNAFATNVNLFQLMYSCHFSWTHSEYGLSSYFVIILKGKYKNDCGYLVVNNNFIGLQNKKFQIVWQSDLENIEKIDYQFITGVLIIHTMDYDLNINDKFAFQLRPNEGFHVFSKIKDITDFKKKNSKNQNTVLKCDICTENISNKVKLMCTICKNKSIHSKCLKQNIQESKNTYKCFNCAELCKAFSNASCCTISKQNKLYYLRYLNNLYFCQLK